MNYLSIHKGKTPPEAVAEVVQEFPMQCSPCGDATTSIEPSPPTSGATPPPPPLEELKTCKDVEDEKAQDHTCGARMNYLHTHEGKSAAEAAAQVAQEFPIECGPCNACFDAMAGDSSCGDRINYLNTNVGMTLTNAVAQVVQEFPIQCGPCGDTATLKGGRVKLPP